jgi:hypothetical protein
MTASWDVVPCSFVAVDRRFRATYCLYNLCDQSFIALMMEAVRTSEMSSTLTSLHVVTYQKAVMFILAAVRT